jgi:hypothetical protein
MQRLVKLSGGDITQAEFLPHLKALSVEDQVFFIRPYSSSPCLSLAYSY